MAKIRFTFEDPNIESVTVDNIEEGTSILEVTEMNDIDLNHNCGGVCACSTCHVYIEKGEEFLEEMTEEEEDRVDLAIDPKLNSRLACQCLLNDPETELEVKIPDQKQIIGHH